jgi:hypothetical protein
MKTKNHIVALQTTEGAASPLFISKEISLTLEQGGYINLTFSGDNLAKCIAGIVRSVEGGATSFDPEIPINITFRYWQLDDDLFDLTLEAGACDFMNGGETVVGCVHRLIAQAKIRFATALSRQQVTLKGQIGQLEAA